MATVSCKALHSRGYNSDSSTMNSWSNCIRRLFFEESQVNCEGLLCLELVISRNTELWMPNNHQWWIENMVDKSLEIYPSSYTSKCHNSFEFSMKTLS